ncbi:MAG: A24 family peptidase [Lachnospiraceae bacterium]|jgi:prepilin signal peptidase PulO-like enzyme (type II secretory pathway)|nr:A24 family peptidase [Lachnospiraceae bacterium]MCH4032177.1 A24 family peptidase [Lachnospiraceae bacterium]MCH4108945.1 A24 family peptidase [Lachnospiraceae bacterium]MCI1332347.1 A24 family peptidase [Lachnospiraceae bacterium]MCI1361702.1 A24 family peptidase [Lachnospiraceae bacterium]
MVLQHIILMAGLLVLSVCDLRTRSIPAGLTLALNAALFLTSVVSGTLRLPAAFSGLLPAFLSFLFTLPDRRKFGAGDIWVLAAVGIVEGAEKTMLIFLTAALLAAFYGVLRCGSRFRKLEVPFIPFLTAAAGGVVLCQDTGILR